MPLLFATGNLYWACRLCDECGPPFTVEHALDCHVRGLVGQQIMK